ncbi:hypothetical protein [Rothia nasimurium]|uniref:hypothetical protein n=1 Tax=Rothia nasimurium TaxID=85336 RepID=UPI001F174506|nr:hypothetical protein [Rothia nasimurium]
MKLKRHTIFQHSVMPSLIAGVYDTFDNLVRIHGPAVLLVCSALLGTGPDAVGLPHTQKAKNLVNFYHGEATMWMHGAASILR